MQKRLIEMKRHRKRDCLYAASTQWNCIKHVVRKNASFQSEDKQLADEELACIVSMKYSA